MALFRHVSWEILKLCVDDESHSFENVVHVFSLSYEVSLDQLDD